MLLIILLIVVVFLLIVFLIFYNFYFLRDPARQIPSGNNIISPADGRVMMIKEFDKNVAEIEKGYLGKVRAMTKDVASKGYIVSIFMSIWNVHFNRAPVDGVVKYVTHNSGKFLKADLLASTFENENVQMLIQDKSFNIKVIQIAGFVARRIVSFIKKNEKVIKGQRIGLIKLGSQVTLIIPSNVNLQVKIGQRVFAGETIIATR
ncbi:MAG: phosphatidylserine decarboxylase family protein [Nanoarchaeota archaeon]|nr:phosphatidylserine decarboxylase family protein [Nanoarchaeota archaeon]